MIALRLIRADDISSTVVKHSRPTESQLAAAALLFVNTIDSREVDEDEKQRLYTRAHARTHRENDTLRHTHTRTHTRTHTVESSMMIIWEKEALEEQCADLCADHSVHGEWSRRCMVVCLCLCVFM
jgi:hypothetical protein